MTPPTERIQKVMARAGLGSRRALEKEIEQGRVQLNGAPAKLGDQLRVDDTLSYDGVSYKVSQIQPAHRTLIYHKPEGEVTTRDDPEGRKTVFDRLPSVRGGRWVAIGRLDINTAGLLLLTTDGELANQMMHPSSGIDREYLCRIRGEVSEEQIEALLGGVMLDDGPAKFSDLVVGEFTGNHTWVTVTLMEGRYREVRRLWEAVGAQVARLKRVRYGPVFLPAAVRSGQYQELSLKDHEILREDAGLGPLDNELTLVSPKQKRPRTQASLTRSNHTKKHNRRRH